MNVIKLARAGLFALLLSLTGAGCWDISPIEDRALALMLGLDRVGDGYRVSIQVPTISNFIQTNNGGVQRDQHAFQAFVEQGASLAGIFQRLEDENYRILIAGSVKVIIVSRSLAEQGLSRLLASFLRQPMISPQTLLLLAIQSPEEILRWQPGFKMQPALIIGKQLRAPLKRSFSYPMELWEFVARVDNRAPDPYLPLIRINRANGSYLLEGLALFRDDKLVGFLSPEEAYLFGILSGKARKAIIQFAAGQDSVTLHNVYHRTRLDVVRSNHRNILRMRLAVKGSILDLPPSMETDRPENLEYLKEEAQRQLTARIGGLIKKFQTLGVDPVGFGNQLIIAGVPEWRETFRQIPFRIQTTIDYRYTPPAR
jgi:spore germination protein